jgi:hypothetical protein
MEGYRKWIIAVVSVVLEAILVWRGLNNLVPDVTLNVIGIINAIFNLIALFAVPTAAGIYMHFNVKQANQLKKK